MPKDEIRALFLARPGHTLFFFDYSQIELRVGATYLNDKLWLDGYKRDDYDIHTETSIIVFGREHKNDEERKFSKNFNFAMLYGAGAPRVANMLKELFGGTVDEHLEKAKQMVYAFRKAHPNLKRYEKDVYQILLTDAVLYEERPWTKFRGIPWRGYIKNRYGRRYCLPPSIIYRWLEYITSGDATGDMLKFKFIEVCKYLKVQNEKCNVVRLTHDEIVIEIPDCKFQTTIVCAIRQIMEDVPKLKSRVPILVDVEYGKDCLNLKKWKGINDYNIGI